MEKCYIIVMFVSFCSLSSAYAIGSSGHDGSYHYEPPQGPRLELPLYSIINSQEFQQQLYQQQQPYYQHQLQQRNYQSQPQLRNNQHRYKQQTQSIQSIPLSMIFTSQGYNRISSPQIEQSNSDSVRLPLPLGVPSINVGPLPLSKGVSYSERPGLTSYGTPYPGRVR